MRRILATIAGILAVLFLLTSVSHAAWSSNRRRAVVLEAFYALRPSHDGGCGVFSSPDKKCFSNWNYIANDTNAASYMRSLYLCNSSNWTNFNDWSGCYNYNAPMSFWANLLSYGYGSYGSYYGAIGRGGQCKYFANLILYRSGSYTSTLPAYTTMWASQSTSNLASAKEGDILFTDGNQGPLNHTAIVVAVNRNGSGTVVSLDVVDSNYISDQDLTGDREAIARHLYYVSNIQGIYRLWTGASYYYEPYVP